MPSENDVVQWVVPLGPENSKASSVFARMPITLVLAPALILFLFVGLFGAEGPVTQVTVFEAAMAPMIGASIVAMDHDLDPPLVTLMLGVGIPLSFLTLPVWWYLLTLI